MSILLKNGKVFTDKGFERLDISIADGKVLDVSPNIDNTNNKNIQKVIHCDNFFVVPGFVDVHVHLREPGFEYKETFETGSAAALKGGYTSVCTMPNVAPSPVDFESLKIQLDRIDKNSNVKIIPFGRLTREAGRVADIESMGKYVAGFSDDGFGVQREAEMREAMKRVRATGNIVSAHCEDESYSTYDPKSEWKQIERDVNISRETGCPYHVCHISSKESIEIVRRAKAEGVDITCEVTPHHVCFNEDIIEYTGDFKMNPPIRKKTDQEAIIEGLKDGTIDMIATDHAPHSVLEKSKGFADSAFGVVGLESAFPAMYSYLVMGNIISMEKLIDLMSINPGRRFKVGGSPIASGEPADLVILDVNASNEIDVNQFKSKGRSCPFHGMRMWGQIVNTIVEGKLYD